MEFIITAKWEESDKRPHKGWSLYHPTPEGSKPVRTRRGNKKRFATLDQVMKYVKKAYKGYFLAVDGDFKGLLK